jgi:hypothetical protein
MSSDSFQLAAQRARQSYPVDDWINLRPHERIAAIYRELKRIDASHVTAQATRRRRSDRITEPEAVSDS